MTCLHSPVLIQSQCLIKYNTVFLNDVIHTELKLSGEPLLETGTILYDGGHCR